MDLGSLFLYLQVGFGIGAVIFVHELGHFLAARLCGVRVRVFSLGFGPRMIGIQRGPTTYQIAWVPLGGYVLMAGEEPDGEAGPPQPDELRAKSVGQRFLIYSGGVIMNVVFGLVVFPLVLAHGVPFVEPVIGRVLPGGPAWEAGIEPGTRVLSVNGEPVVGFMNIASEVALAGDEGVVLEIVPPGAPAPSTVQLAPNYNAGTGFNSIDVLPSFDAEGRLEVLEGSPAYRAGLRSGDHLRGLVDGFPGLPLARQLELAMNRGEDMELEVVSGPDGSRAGLHRVTVEAGAMPGDPRPRLGIQPPYQHIFAVRDSDVTEALGARADDRVLAANGDPIWRPGDLLHALVDHDGPVSLRVRRQGAELELEGPVLDREAALALVDDLALRLDVESDVLVVVPDSPAFEAGLRDGDQVRRIDDVEIDGWQAIPALARDAGRTGRTMAFSLARRSEAEGVVLLELEATPEAWQQPGYGFGVREAYYTYRTESLGQAVTVGVRQSWKFLVDTWMTLKRILQGRVSSENIGGIITIGAVSYSWASLGFAKLLFFLCMLSINLAFLNVLPIPVLDGGHLFFLLVEKIKGSPVSERVLGYSQMVGLVLILSLMIYVTYNDILRVFRIG